jgi:hypothetical protein
MSYLDFNGLYVHAYVYDGVHCPVQIYWHQFIGSDGYVTSLV